ncbi:uncharacterized protein ARMOST_02312 [Armillaria ostoyae]|uniref:Uncharacterized protein n=1 Tax=Armillaria ostoyae TaxID=47428 RepID=A0A284QRK9_ARMOS|nr:uncharacterized protein ARMOST_02312 [Armillaria ostoyae]
MSNSCKEALVSQPHQQLDDILNPELCRSSKSPPSLHCRCVHCGAPERLEAEIAGDIGSEINGGHPYSCGHAGWERAVLGRFVIAAPLFSFLCFCYASFQCDIVQLDNDYSHLPSELIVFFSLPVFNSQAFISPYFLLSLVGSPLLSRAFSGKSGKGVSLDASATEFSGLVVAHTYWNWMLERKGMGCNGL